MRRFRITQPNTTAQLLSPHPPRAHPGNAFPLSHASLPSIHIRHPLHTSRGASHGPNLSPSSPLKHILNTTFSALLAQSPSGLPGGGPCLIQPTHTTLIASAHTSPLSEYAGNSGGANSTSPTGSAGSATSTRATAHPKSLSKSVGYGGAAASHVMKMFEGLTSRCTTRAQQRRTGTARPDAASRRTVSASWPVTRNASAAHTSHSIFQTKLSSARSAACTRSRSVCGGSSGRVSGWW
jgi:hypothetical protein